MNVYPKQRNLDGVFYRVERYGKWCNVCFTDLTKTEQRKVLLKYDKDALMRVLNIINSTMSKLCDVALTKEEIEEVIIQSADIVRSIADDYNIIGREDEDDE